MVARLGPASRFPPSTVLLIGSFFGEALIKDLAGEWTVRGRTTSDVSVEIVTAKGTVEANVFGKATKLLRNGIEDSLAAMAVSIRERIT